MALSLPGSGATALRVTTDMLRIGASRALGSALEPPKSLTLGGGVSSGVSYIPAAGPKPAPDYTDTIKKSKNKNINALLAGGSHWFHGAGQSGEVPSASARTKLTYSFLADAGGLSGRDANGFAELGAAHKQRVRDVFTHLSTLIDVEFEEVASGGDLRYGSNDQGATSAGYAYYPTGSGSTVLISNTSSSFAGNWDEDSYGWQVLLHETAHALGLKHPGNYNAGGGGTPGPYLAKALDNRSQTVMSYKNAGNVNTLERTDLGGGAYTLKSSSVYGQGYQNLDILALQYLYGASTSVQAQAYGWSDGAKFTATLWNPNQGSEIDLSSQTGTNILDLRAGKKSSIGIIDPYAAIGMTKKEYTQRKDWVKAMGLPTYTGKNNLTIAAGSQFTRGIGGSGDDKIVANALGGYLDGGAGQDMLFWTGGNLSVQGGDGNDTLLLKKMKNASWSITEDENEPGKFIATLTSTAKKNKGQTLSTVDFEGIESVRFWNGSALKATGKALWTA